MNIKTRFLGCLIGIFVSAVVLTACQSSVNIPLDNAKLDIGYLNNRNVALGLLYYWDTKNDRLTFYRAITKDMVDSDVTLWHSGLTTEANSKLSSDTEMDLSANLAGSSAVSGSVHSAISQATNVDIKNYKTVSYNYPSYVLNCAKMRSFRESIPSEFATDRYKFVLITGEVFGDSVNVSLTGSNTAGGGVNAVQVGNYSVKVSFDSQDSVSISAPQITGSSATSSSSGGTQKRAPILVTPSIFSFRINNATSPAGLSFEPYNDLPSSKNNYWQTVK
jgi:hypothetical protein